MIARIRPQRDVVRDAEDTPAGYVPLERTRSKGISALIALPPKVLSATAVRKKYFTGEV